MAREFRLPDLGSGLKEAQIISWRVAQGDAVTIESVLCEVETEKAVIEVPVPFPGVVLKLAAPEGETIAVGDVLAIIGEAGETQPETKAEKPAAATIPPKSSTGSALPTRPGGETINKRPKAMPSIRRLARELGVDLTTVEGSGRHGRITRGDVTTAAAPAAATATAKPGGTTKKLTSLRKSIADHMSKSWREIPHCFARMDVDAERILETRRSLSEQFECRVPIEALVIKAVIPVLREFPEFNATLNGDELTLHDHFDIGVAADTKDGLIVPVIHGADTMRIGDLSTTLNELMGRAVERRATPDELSGATFTVNNIGALGSVMGTSIIPYGTTAILSVGRALEKAVVRHGAIRVASMMEVTLSFDHRVVDGGTTQKFMRRVGENLEQPVRFLA